MRMRPRTTNNQRDTSTTNSIKEREGTVSKKAAEADDCAHRFLARLRTLLYTDAELRNIESESPVSVRHSVLLQLASEVMIGVPEDTSNDNLEQYPKVAELFQRLYEATAEFVLADGGRVVPFEE